MNFSQENASLHLLDIKSLSKETIQTLLLKANEFLAAKNENLLKGKVIANLFFEPSTRTRCSFELAAKGLGAEVINVDLKHSSTSKGETDFDTFKTLAAMGVNAFVVRHSKNNAVAELAQKIQLPVSFINAGDGMHAHPTQALLDLLTISQSFDSFENLTVAIVGDIRHSRVANSDIEALKLMRVKEIRLIGPPEFLPREVPSNCSTYQDFNKGLANVDVIIMLRIQKERLNQEEISYSSSQYQQEFCLTSERVGLANPKVIILHPGPINREVEITSEVADGPHSVILKQVTNGVAMRMAVLAKLLLHS